MYDDDENDAPTRQNPSHSMSSPLSASTQQLKGPPLFTVTPPSSALHCDVVPIIFVRVHFRPVVFVCLVSVGFVVVQFGSVAHDSDRACRRCAQLRRLVLGSRWPTVGNVRG